MTENHTTSKQPGILTPLQRLQEKFSDKIIESHVFRGDETAVIGLLNLRSVARFLKETPEMDFNFLMDLTAVDYLFYTGGRVQKEFRFEVVYHFFSLKFNKRIRIKVPVDEKNPQVDTLSDLWASANWYEREVWDMFGIQFKGHPNLKRILMYDQFEGHALRKDYPFNKRQPLIGPIN
ncbi:MAG: NADH-quinone oxidoreductase subunit C [Candidatus Omnitrophica bacterium]|nr:NADH-quinone oxidoreductase subunit C [Candidatus Omnitrophota bacterium]